MSDFYLLSPLWIVTIGGLLILVLDILSKPRASRDFLGYILAVTFMLAFFAVLVQWTKDVSLSSPYVAPILKLDPFAAFFASLVLVSGAASALFAVGHLREHASEYGEFYVLLAFSALGAIVLFVATDLVTAFLGLEIMSLSLYCLAAMKKSSIFSTEAGMKYFVLGGVGSAFFLFGVAFLYGETGSLNIVEMARYFSLKDPAQSYLLPQIGLILVLCGVAFKVASVPFHMWTPDVYEGALTPSVTFMASAVKVSAFALMARFFFTVFQNTAFLSFPVPFPDTVLVLSILSMVVGNVLGIVQKSVKRILAYSSIAHAGYVLLGVYAVQKGDNVSLNDAVPFYLLTYAVASLGAFGIVAILQSKGVEDTSLERFAGLSKKHPFLSMLFLCFLLSLAGIPPFAGFMGKFYLFKEVLAKDTHGNLLWVIIAVLNSLVALFYYLRIAVYMYFKEPDEKGLCAIKTPAGVGSAVVLAMVVLWVGIAPGRFLNASASAAQNAGILVQKRVTEEVKPVKPPITRALLEEAKKHGREQ